MYHCSKYIATVTRYCKVTSVSAYDYAVWCSILSLSVREMTEPAAKKPCTDDGFAGMERTTDRVIAYVIRKMMQDREVSANELMLRELLMAHARQYWDTLSEEPRAVDLRATLARAGLTDVTVLADDSDLPADANMLMCGHIDLDVFLLQSNKDMMKCNTFVLTRLSTGLSVVYGGTPGE